MKKLITLLGFVFAINSLLFSQSNKTGTITGKLIDYVSRQNIPDATISILNTKDSSLAAQRVSQKDGSFVVGQIPLGNYIFQVTFQGYLPVERNISIGPGNPTYNIGTILLTSSLKDLGTVVVKSSAPITVKGDTTEFNASRYQTKPNANAGDLLKKIPGVEVDREGGVKAQGEQVAKIMVDGKMFFGNDAKLATQNLPTDIIDKIQIIDAQSDQAAFTGFDDGVQEKVINIVTKKDRR
jgi:hypothetical protein